MPIDNAEDDGQAEGSPYQLLFVSMYPACSHLEALQSSGDVLTTVRDSMHSINGSEVMYLESERAYSFHNCANRLCDAAREP